MLKKLTLAILVVITAFVLGGLLLPNEYRVERSIQVARNPVVVFTLLDGYRNFVKWSPWAEKDPDTKYGFSGPETGVGARLDWSGDPRQVGSGWQQITLSKPYERLEMRLDFGAQGVADSYFAIQPEQDGSELTWGFVTDVSAGKGVLGAMMGRYFGLLLERWVGADFENGLLRFKAFAEQFPDADFSSASIELVDVQPVEILYVPGSSSQAASDVAEALAAAFAEVSVFMADHGIEMAGQPMAITRGWDEKGYRFDAAIPVAGLPQETSGNVLAGLSPSGRAVRIEHIGPYEGLLEAYDQLATYMAAHGISEGPLSWEHYVSDPGQTPEAELITHIYILLRE